MGAETRKTLDDIDFDEKFLTIEKAAELFSVGDISYEWEEDIPYTYEVMDGYSLREPFDEEVTEYNAGVVAIRAGVFFDGVKVADCRYGDEAFAYESTGYGVDEEDFCDHACECIDSPKDMVVCVLQGGSVKDALVNAKLDEPFSVDDVLYGCIEDNCTAFWGWEVTLL